MTHPPKKVECKHDIKSTGKESSLRTVCVLIVRARDGIISDGLMGKERKSLAPPAKGPGGRNLMEVRDERLHLGRMDVRN